MKTFHVADWLGTIQGSHTDAVAHGPRHVAVWDDLNSLVCVCGPADDLESEQNAYLFAAGPELVEACRAWISFASCQTDAGAETAKKHAILKTDQAFEKLYGNKPNSSVNQTVEIIERLVNIIEGPGVGSVALKKTEALKDAKRILDFLKTYLKVKEWQARREIDEG